jgi:subtilase family serine protease
LRNFAKPSWQTGLNVPADGVRDTPDISMGASGEMPGFWVSTNTWFTTTGGTSIASPMFAGVTRLIAQAQGVTRLGNINPRLYELGDLQDFDLTGIHDVTMGNNDNGGIKTRPMQPRPPLAFPRDRVRTLGNSR